VGSGNSASGRLCLLGCRRRLVILVVVVVIIIIIVIVIVVIVIVIRCLALGTSGSRCSGLTLGRWRRLIAVVVVVVVIIVIIIVIDRSRLGGRLGRRLGHRLALRRRRRLVVAVIIVIAVIIVAVVIVNRGGLLRHYCRRLCGGLGSGLSSDGSLALGRRWRLIITVIITVVVAVIVAVVSDRRLFGRGCGLGGRLRSRSGLGGGLGWWGLVV
jgi:uncharacterized BrkB/YihY/UPF0761 family membrane protein